MRTDKHAEGAEEDGKILPALRVFLPGEAIPTPYAPAAERRFEPNRATRWTIHRYRHVGRLGGG
jgi:hypothetical protein